MPRMAHVGNDIWEKICTRCKRAYKIEAKTWREAISSFTEHFSICSNSCETYDGFASWCKGCKNNKKYKRIDDTHRDDMVAAQNNECGICCIPISFIDRTANIDHCHVTGKNRKVLCRLCNVWMAAIDNDEWLAKATAYRDFFRGTHNSN